MLKTFPCDKFLLVIVLFLLAVGIIMIYSSSAIFAGEKFDDPNRFLLRQIAWTLLGLASLYVFLQWDYHKLPIVIYAGLLVCLLSLITVLIPKFGVEINGARRWLSFGFINFQPSEFTKLILTLYFAFILAKKRERIQDFNYAILPLLVLISLYLLLIVLEPDLGTVIIIGIILFSMLFLAGARMSHLMVLVLGLLPFLYVLIWHVGYRRERILAFLEPEKDPLNTGFQVIQSKIAIGSGGTFGRGLGEGVQKLYYLPESHTDFIYSVLCEELGFIGGVTIIILFMLFIWRGMRIALHAPDYYGSLLATGITLMIGIQAFINMAVVMGIFPTKGLALPFISFGGSSLLSNLTATGILLNISAKV
ncbi:putative lipid II flippase FtsW [candidate division CSSED10-310 bacterium]|uniref:Probable peptidoglycan glycosyltransferase FtsW n=1 Tax=candidate division CSSED10-310 bacterium TaxID=2855610 RepID=A0ABV6YUZ9_UNCC1